MGCAEVLCPALASKNHILAHLWCQEPVSCPIQRTLALSHPWHQGLMSCPIHEAKELCLVPFGGPTSYLNPGTHVTKDLCPVPSQRHMSWPIHDAKDPHPVPPMGPRTHVLSHLEDPSQGLMSYPIHETKDILFHQRIHVLSHP